MRRDVFEGGQERRRKVRGKRMTGARVGSVVREERRAAEAVRERVMRREEVRDAVARLGEDR